MNSKKRPFVLVEFLVAFTLFAAVVSVLFGLFSYNSRLTRSLQEEEKKSEEMRLFHMKLQNLFTHLEGMGRDKQDIFHTATQESSREEGQSLVFAVLVETDREPEFAGSCLAKLFFDRQEKTIALCLWPDPRKYPEKRFQVPPCRLIPLLDQVEDVRFSFWLAPSMKESDLTGKNFDKEKRGTWLDTWPQEYKIMPTLLKIEVKRKDALEPILLSFVVSENIGAVDYR